MSIENNLKRIADALEAIAANIQDNESKSEVVDETPATRVQTEPAPIAPPAPPAAEVPPAPPAAEVPPAPPAAPEPTVVMTAEELNTALVAEAGRIGSPEPIRETLTAMGANGVTDLDPSQYAQLLDTVKAISAQ